MYGQFEIESLVTGVGFTTVQLSYGGDIGMPRNQGPYNIRPVQPLCDRLHQQVLTLLPVGEQAA